MTQPMTPEACFADIATRVAALLAGLSPRERDALRAGLRAAHAEEALLAGEPRRASAHFDVASALARKLSSEGASSVGRGGVTSNPELHRIAHEVFRLPAGDRKKLHELLHAFGERGTKRAMLKWAIKRAMLKRAMLKRAAVLAAAGEE